MFCPICSSEFTDKKHPYFYHKIKYADFMEKYYPKMDLLTKEPIKFGNKTDETYFLTDFNSKFNLKRYLESISKKDGFKYLTEWLIRRKKYKNLIYSPSEIELKTLCYPSISFFHKFYGKQSYEDLCTEIGLINRYDYNQNIKLNNYEPNFVVDSREKNVLKLKNYQIKCLDYGDYTIENSNIFIERKSLNDIISTLSKGFDRFKREIERCGKDNNYLIILIEEKFSNLQSIQYLPYIHSKCTFEFIAHRIREILYNYPETIQLVCCDGRIESAKFIKNIYNIINDIRTIDLQYIINNQII